MLGNQVAAGSDERLCGILLFGLVIPGAGEHNLHDNILADRLCTEVEGGITGNYFRVGVCTDITHGRNLTLELAFFFELVELHACGNACQVSALINACKSIVEVVLVLCVSGRTGCMAELNIREFFCNRKQEGLMSEGICENHVAALVNQVACSLCALLGFGNVSLEDDLIIRHAKCLLCFLNAVDEVQVVGGVFVVQKDDAELYLRNVCGNLVGFCAVFGAVICAGCFAIACSGRALFISVRAGCEADANRKCHHNHKCKGKYLFEHVNVLQFFVFLPGIPRQ